jgi:hypothetical protein
VPVSRTTIAAGQPAAWHIFATGSRLGWAGGLGRYSVGPADRSIIEHLQAAGEHAMWANRESYAPTLAWPGWNSMRTTFRSWADTLQRNPTNEMRRRIAVETAGQIPGLSQVLNYQTVGTTEYRANCDAAYVRLGFYLGYGEQVMQIADEAVRNGDRSAASSARQDAISHLNTANSILIEYEKIVVASGRCADLKDVRTLLQRLFAINLNDITAQTSVATAAWDLANRRIAALGGAAPGPVQITQPSPTPPAAPPASLLVTPKPTPSTSSLVPRTDGYYRTREGNGMGIGSFFLFIRFLDQGAVRMGLVRRGMSAEVVWVGGNPLTVPLKPEDQAPQGISVLQQSRSGPYDQSFDQPYAQQGNSIPLRASVNGSLPALLRYVQCTDSVELVLRDNGLAITALYSCRGRPIRDELIFVPYRWQ